MIVTLFSVQRQQEHSSTDLDQHLHMLSKKKKNTNTFRAFISLVSGSGAVSKLEKHNSDCNANLAFGEGKPPPWEPDRVLLSLRHRIWLRLFALDRLQSWTLLLFAFDFPTKSRTEDTLRRKPNGSPAAGSGGVGAIIPRRRKAVDSMIMIMVVGMEWNCYGKSIGDLNIYIYRGKSGESEWYFKLKGWNLRERRAKFAVL